MTSQQKKHPLFFSTSGKKAYGAFVALVLALGNPMPLSAQSAQWTLNPEESLTSTITAEESADRKAEKISTPREDSVSFLMDEMRMVESDSPSIGDAAHSEDENDAHVLPQPSDTPVPMTYVSRSSNWTEMQGPSGTGYKTGSKNQYLNYSLQADNAGDYRIEMSVKNDAPAGWRLAPYFGSFLFNVHVDGVFKGTLSVLGSDTEFKQGSFTVQGLAAGTHTVRLTNMKDVYHLSNKYDSAPWVDSVKAFTPNVSGPLRTLYVDASAGVDTNGGAQGAPWKTLQHAANQAQAGDLIIVKAGTYAQGFNLWDGTTGTAQNPIIFRAEPGAIITGRNAATADAINIENGNFFVVEGFTIDNTAGAVTRTGIRVANADDVILRNNTIDMSNYGTYGQGVWGILTGFARRILIENNETSRSGGQHGIYVSNSYDAEDKPVIRGNHVWGNAINGIQLNGDLYAGGDGLISGAVIENNTVHNNGVKGLSIISVANSDIRNNLIYNNHLSGAGAAAIHLAEEPGTNRPSSNNRIVNNTLHETAMVPVRITNGTGNVVFNNLAAGNINFVDEAGGNFIDAASNVKSASTAGLFVNTAAGDYTLLNGSAAVNTGVAAYSSVTAPLKDHAGNSRPQGTAYDAGAFEFIPPSDSTPPVISGAAAANITQTAAVINWTTNEASDSVVEVLEGAAWVAKASNAALVTAHTLSLSGLTAATAYQVRVKSKDAAGNTAVSSAFTLTTQTDSGSGEAPMTYASRSSNWWEMQGPSGTGYSTGTKSQYLNYTLQANAAGDYRVEMSVKNNAPAGWRLAPYFGSFLFDVHVDGVFKGTLSVPGSDTEFRQGSLTVTGLAAGTHTVRLTNMKDVYHLSNKYDSAPWVDYVKAFKPPAPGDTAPPVISSVQASNITAASASVSWTTDETSDSAVEFFDGTNWTVKKSDPQLSLTHTINLTGLAPLTAYQYRVVSKDAAGNKAVSGSFSFTTLNGDTTAPVISGVLTQSRTVNGAVIAWNTNEPANSRIEYGRTTAYGAVKEAPSYASSHSLQLTGMLPDTLYHYRVLSRDEAGNQAASADFTFLTDSSGGLTNVPTLFLDFDGTFLSNWGSYTNVTVPVFDKTGNASVFDESELTLMDQVKRAVIEKFSIFNLNVTLDDPFAPFDTYTDPAEKFTARNSFYETGKVVQIAVGGSSSGVLGISAAGGVAYVDSFSRTLQNTVFVFPDNLSKAAQYIWEAAAHEAGHAFGAWHQSVYDGSGNKTTEYNPGANGVAPIMGNSYNKRGLWWVGPSTSSSTIQNDMQIIARSANGFGFRSDDHGNSPVSASAFSDVYGTAFGAYGVVNDTSDSDYFKFTLTEAGNVSFTAAAAAHGAMLDLQLELRGASDNLLVNKNTAALGESILNYALTPGTYYLTVKSKGAYIGDVGQYWIEGTVPLNTITP